MYKFFLIGVVVYDFVLFSIIRDNLVTKGGRSLMRLDAVVIASWNSFSVLLIALLRLVPCFDSTTG